MLLHSTVDSCDLHHWYSTLDSRLAQTRDRQSQTAGAGVAAVVSWDQIDHTAMAETGGRMDHRASAVVQQYLAVRQVCLDVDHNHGRTGCNPERTADLGRARVLVKDLGYKCGR